MIKRKDHYYFKAKKEKVISRSYFKLEQIDRRYNLIKNGALVVDVGCSPGGWSKYIVKKTGKGGRVVGVDIAEPQFKRENFVFIRADILKDETWDKIKGEIKEADAVLSDVAPKTTGVKFRDVALSLELSKKVFDHGKKILKRGGNMLIKVFEGEGFDEFTSTVKKCFKMVKPYKPAASRKESKETYLIMKHFKGIKGVLIFLLFFSILLPDARAEKKISPRVFQKIVKYIKSGKLKSAESLFNKVYNAAPQNQKVLRVGGYLYLKTGKFKKAEELLKKAINKDSSDYISLNNLAILYMYTGEPDKSIFYFNLAARTSNDKYYYYNLASAFYEIGNYEESFKAIEKALSLDQTFGLARFLKGIVLYEMGDFEQAKKIFLNMQKQDKSKLMGIIGFGTVLESEEKISEAIKYFAKAIELKANDPLIRLHLGNLYFKEGNFERARTQYEYAYKIAKKSDLRQVSNLMSSVSSVNFGDYRKYFLNRDKNDLLKRIKENKLPFDPLSLMVNAIYFRKSGNYKLAIKILKQALKKTTKLKDVILFELGKTYFYRGFYGLSKNRLKDLKNAGNYLQRAFVLNPDDVDIPFYLGLSKFYTGLIDEKGGQKELFQAISIFKNLTRGKYKSDSFQYITLAYYKVGDCKNTLINYDKYVKTTNSPDENLYLIAGDCYLNQNKLTEAIELFKNYLKVVPEDGKVKDIVNNLEEDLRAHKKNKEIKKK